MRDSTKRFIVWSNAQFVPLALKLADEERRLEESDPILHGNEDGARRESPNEINIQGPRNAQMKAIQRLPGLSDRLGSVFVLREEVRRFLSKVKVDEQPFSKVHRMYQEAQRTCQKPTGKTFEFEAQILQTRQSK